MCGMPASAGGEFMSNRIGAGTRAAGPLPRRLLLVALVVSMVLSTNRTAFANCDTSDTVTNCPGICSDYVTNPNLQTCAVDADCPGFPTVTCLLPAGGGQILLN